MSTALPSADDLGAGARAQFVSAKPELLGFGMKGFFEKFRGAGRVTGYLNQRHGPSRGFASVILNRGLSKERTTIVSPARLL
jgi:hypothetical protein